MRPSQIKINHPWFQYCDIGASPYTFIFSKPEWGPQDSAQLAKWKRNEKIVLAHGGRMIESEYQIGREHQDPLTEAEVEKLKDVVSHQCPTLTVYTHWNGAGSYGVSIGAKEAQ